MVGPSAGSGDPRTAESPSRTGVGTCLNPGRYLSQQIENVPRANRDRIFRLRFGERDYKKHLNLATVECAQGGIRSILDYVRREG